ncbi:hypothetical protein LGT39_06530 [Demequina sp. TTPB684]|uniref:hypothetical protein n=1 Tax=unclassified Demequina TaxID=2620311 RepID=UPI001CF4F3D6|nr:MULTISPECIES: hypothetical protein [unclassified Demequina]MCB2412504.1 hypothetical protein [Demequina sp. TTPB684]UPU88793.1 hypothetical protein LGT36_002400 [Demequina sp. TMPB413]
MTKQANPIAQHTALRISVGAASGAVAAAVLASIAWAAGNDSFAKGIVWGGTVGIAAVVALLMLARTRFATAEARLVADAADERERRLATDAMALAAIAMYAAAVLCAMATLFGLEPEASLAIIMFTGLITAAVAFAVSVRRD